IGRWAKRLAGLENSLRRELAGHGGEEALSARLQRNLNDLAALRAFALPLLDALAALPREATWGEWLDPLTALATRALREPARVLSLLAELAPMAPVGPITLSEVRLVLGRRLTELPVPPSGKRHGRGYVGKIASAG